MTRDEIALIVQETLVQIGVDTKDPTEMQADFAWMRRSRVMAEKSWTGVISAVLGGVAVLLITNVWSWLWSSRH